MGRRFELVKAHPIVGSQGLACCCCSDPAHIICGRRLSNSAGHCARGWAGLARRSYGGAVITEAGNNPKVAGLVYVSAVAPDQGESTFGLITSVATPIGSELRPDKSGFLKLTPKGVAEDFAQDLPAKEIAVLIATQVPVSVAAMKGEVTIPAWKSKPSWYIVAANDRAISPDLEVAQAKKIRAATTTVPSSHVVMLSQPSKVAGVIIDAASQARSN